LTRNALAWRVPSKSHVGSLITEILPLAAGAAISPTILTLSVLILSGPHGKARQTVFTIVNVALMAAFAIFGANYLSHIAGKHHSGKVHTASLMVDITLGVVLILLAVREHFTPAKDTERDQADDASKSKGLAIPRYALLGVVMTITNFTTLALFLPALKVIGVSHSPSSDKLVAEIFLVIVATITAWLPLLLTAVAPKPAARILGGINQFTTTYKHQIVEGVFLIFGIYLLVKGLRGS